MRRDVDRCMEERGLDALLVCGPPHSSWETAYLVGPLKVTEAYVYKRRGENPVLIVKAMERGEAAKGACLVLTFHQLGLTPIRRSALSKAEREAAILARILEHFGAGGRVALHGTGPIDVFADAVRLLRESCGELEIVCEAPGILEVARSSKDADEIASIENVGRRLQDVFRHTVNYLGTLIRKQGLVCDIEGEPILVGDVKELVVREAARRRLEVPVDVILSQGALSSVPHNRGENDEVLIVGVPIVFDLIGRDREGGYHFEITRTFCLGEIPDRVEEIHRQVARAREIALEELRPGRSAADANAVVSELFEEAGYPTLRREPTTERGFVHYLGHGIGLAPIEEPYVGPLEEPMELTPGMVVTVEPGLYLPDEGIGVRIGDIAVIEKTGAACPLDSIPKEPLIPLSG
ncbi:MAG: M24 family metallopeptidase [Planctomycetota bacterium]